MNIRQDFEIRDVELSGLIAAPYNPRAISDEALGGLEASITRFGLVEPIIWNETSGRVVGGHQRLKVLARQGVARVKVVVVHLSETEEKALNVTLNNHALCGDWTADLNVLLAEIKSELPSEEYLRLRIEALEGELSHAGALTDAWGCPPFTAFDGRSEWWQERRRLLDEACGGLPFSDEPVFDPVLAEILLRWFTPAGGLVFDPLGDPALPLITAQGGRGYACSPKEAPEAPVDAVFASITPVFNIAHMALTFSKLAENHFACLVIHEARDTTGQYRNIAKTLISLAHTAGLHYYNEAALIVPESGIESAFRERRHLARAHCGILIFLRGDAKKAAEACGNVAISIQDSR
jgi:hypothetical protein